jgi:hypothetical protein
MTLSTNSERRVLLGSEVPRIWTHPLRDLDDEANSLGHEVVEFSEKVLEIPLLPWQKWLFVHGLELKPNGNYRFRTVLVLVPRQCGKTTLLWFWRYGEWFWMVPRPF